MKKTLILLLIFCMVATFALTACGGSSAPAPAPATDDGEDSGDAPASTDPIIIGALYPVTGNYALLGTESYRGLQIAVDEWNANGGILGREIQLVFADIPDTTIAQTECERLINKEGVQLLVGSYSSALAHANADVCARYDIPFVEMGGIAADLMEKGYPYLWRTCADTAQFGVTAVDYLINGALDSLGVTAAELKVCIPHEDSNYGTCIAEAETAELLAAGVPQANIKEIPYSASSVDLSTVVLDMKSFAPQAILATSYANDSVLLGRQCKELGLEMPFFCGAGGGHSLASTLEALGNDMYGVCSADFPQYRVKMEGNENLADYMDAYRAKFNEEPLSGHSLCNYAGANMVFTIIENAGGSLDKDDFKAAAQAMNVEPGWQPGGWGCKFNEVGQNVNAPIQVAMWTPNTLDCVWPLNYAMTDFVAPRPTWAELAKMSF